MKYNHTTVLLKEMIDYILTDINGIYVDCTLGGGGHSFALAEERLRGARCKHVAVRSNFSLIDEILDSLHVDMVNGFIFDLGVSSYQLDESERGFSYMNDGKLDMRMDRRQALSAYEVVNTYTEKDLEKIISAYGEERWASRIAEFIVDKRVNRPIETTDDLVKVIKAAIPAGARRNGPHPAKRTFQAIRIEVNNELGILQTTIEKCVKRLKKGGRLGIITFQSLEDRIVKNTFREMEKDCICPPDIPICVCNHRRLVKKVGKPMKPSDEEIKNNPRSRSAVLRVVEKV